MSDEINILYKKYNLINCSLYIIPEYEIFTKFFEIFESNTSSLVEINIINLWGAEKSNIEYLLKFSNWGTYRNCYNFIFSGNEIILNVYNGNLSDGSIKNVRWTAKLNLIQNYLVLFEDYINKEFQLFLEQNLMKKN